MSMAAEAAEAYGSGRAKTKKEALEIAGYSPTSCRSHGYTALSKPENQAIQKKARERRLDKSRGTLAAVERLYRTALTKLNGLEEAAANDPVVLGSYVKLLSDLRLQEHKLREIAGEPDQSAPSKAWTASFERIGKAMRITRHFRCLGRVIPTDPDRLERACAVTRRLYAWSERMEPTAYADGVQEFDRGRTASESAGG